ncbi:MAG: DUF2938 domain-containing protein [Kofleriaceae bacterium]
MTGTVEAIVRTISIGVGATMIMDLWAAGLRKLGVPSLNFAFLGRWIGHLPSGRFIHDSIAKAPRVRGELALGWGAHYATGIAFAALLVAAFGLSWARSPSLAPALFIGIVTVVAPLFILQPGMGAGIASSRTPTPVFNALKSVVTHTVYGAGLYLAALATGLLIPAAG